MYDECMRTFVRYAVGTLVSASLLFGLGFLFLSKITDKPASSEKSPATQGDVRQDGNARSDNSPIQTQIRSWNALGETQKYLEFKGFSDTLKERIQLDPGLGAIATSLEETQKIIEPLNPAPKKPTMPDAVKELSVLSDTENVFPKYYTDQLDAIQNAFVGRGIWKSEEKIPLVSERAVFQMLDKSLDTIIKLGAYSSEEARIVAKQALLVNYKNIWLSERELVKKGILSQSGGKCGSPNLSKETGIWNGMLSILAPQEARAQYSDIIDTFVTIPDCWKAKNRQGGTYKGGTNIEFALCCNCGLLIIPPYEYEFVWDCGTEDSGDCNVPLGCLNMNCSGNNNAIYDGIPGYKEPATAGWGGGFSTDWSFVCGCDAYADATGN